MGLHIILVKTPRNDVSKFSDHDTGYINFCKMVLVVLRSTTGSQTVGNNTLDAITFWFQFIKVFVPQQTFSIATTTIIFGVCQSVWLDVGIKVAQMSPKVAQNSNHKSLYLKSELFQNSPKVNKYFGQFC